MRRALLLIPFLWLGCDEAREVELLFSRGASDPTLHVFPTDEYKGDVVLDRFTEEQIAAVPFVRQLLFTAQLGWAPTTGLRIPFTPVFEQPGEWVDLETVADALRVYRLADAAAPTLVELGEMRHQQRTNALLVRPRAPWLPGRYAVVVLDGRLRTRSGAKVVATADQKLVIRDGDAATDADFAAVDAADGELAGRGDTLAFWTFTVADATGQMRLLKSYIDGKVAVDWSGRDEVLDVTPIMPVEGRELAVGGARVVAEGDEALTQLFEAAGVGALPRDKIGKIVGGAIATPVFVSDPVPDPVALFFNGTFQGRNTQAPFAPNNPLSVSKATPSRLLPYLMVIPKVHAPKLPIIVAMHGITRSKEDWLAFANTACATGHALIGIDLYQHGDRQAAIEVAEGGFATRVDPVLAAGGVNFPDPFLNPTFLARTRDKLRQSIVDNLALIRLLSAGDGANPLIDFDGNGAPDALGPIRLVGHSLGAILGTAVVAVSPEIDRAVLNVPGSHLTQIINDSPRLSKDIDLLLYATGNAQGIGLLAGSERFLVPDGPERELFSRVSETILAAVDPASFAAAAVNGALGNEGPRILVQLALGDDVVTNRANVRYAHALASGGEAGEVVAIGPVLFDLDLPITESLAPVGVSQFAGGHGLLLDFVDVAVTAAAQQQAAMFLAAP